MEEGRFTNYLEKKARILVSEPRRVDSGFSVTNLIKQEIKMTLEQLSRLRKLKEGQLKSLLRTECYVNTQLMQTNHYNAPYNVYLGNQASRHSDRNTLYQRLFTIESERRKQAIFQEGQLQGLQKKLLSLMQKHGQLRVQ